MTTPGTVNGMHPQTAMTLGVLLQRLSGNPKTRQRTIELIKEIDPGYRLPADVAVADLERRLRAEAAQTRQTEHQQRQKNRMAKDRKALVETHGEDVVKDIEEKILKAKPNLTYQEAAVLHAAKDGPALPPSREPLPKFRHGQTWEFPDLPGLMQNPDKAATDMAYSMIDAFHAGQRP
jgi:hypothetical protein